MVYSPGRRPLRMLTVNELQGMLTSASENVQYSVNDILGELTYREQRRLNRLVALLMEGR